MPIHEKLLEVMKAVAYVQKDSNNREQNYKYASEGAFISAVRPAMLDAGLVCYPIAIDQQIGKTPSEKQMLTMGAATFRFLDVSDGSHIDIIAPYAGADSTDKFVYKAMTGARKYALRQAFLIETGDDPERDEAPAPHIEAVAKAKEQVERKTAAAKAEVAAEVASDPWLTHGKVIVKNTTPVETAAYAEQLSRLGLTNADACKLLGVDSMKAGRSSNTLDSVIQEVARALIEQNQRPDSDLAARAKALLKK